MKVKEECILLFDGLIHCKAFHSIGWKNIGASNLKIILFLLSEFLITLNKDVLLFLIFFSRYIFYSLFLIFISLF